MMGERFDPWNHAGLALVLTDREGGNWCFYYGFDQYFARFSDTRSMALYESDELAEANRTVEFQDKLAGLYLKGLKGGGSQEAAAGNDR